MILQFCGSGVKCVSLLPGRRHREDGEWTGDGLEARAPAAHTGAARSAPEGMSTPHVLPVV